MKILFLHHRTGQNVWNGGVAQWISDNNRENKTDYQMEETAFSKNEPYGWHNYPFGYWNIWMKNAGEIPF